MSETQYNALSVRLELQADCFAGVWAHHAQNRNLLEAGDVEEAMRAASAIGDDTIQRQHAGPRRARQLHARHFGAAHALVHDRHEERPDLGLQHLRGQRLSTVTLFEWLAAVCGELGWSVMRSHEMLDETRWSDLYEQGVSRNGRPARPRRRLAGRLVQRTPGGAAASRGRCCRRPHAAGSARHRHAGAQSAAPATGRARRRRWLRSRPLPDRTARTRARARSRRTPGPRSSTSSSTASSAARSSTSIATAAMALAHSRAGCAPVAAAGAHCPAGSPARPAAARRRARTLRPRRPVRSTGSRSGAAPPSEATRQQDLVDQLIEFSDVAREFRATRRRSDRPASSSTPRRMRASGERSSCEALASSDLCASTSCSMRAAASLKLAASCGDLVLAFNGDARAEIARTPLGHAALQAFEPARQTPHDRIGADADAEREQRECQYRTRAAAAVLGDAPAVSRPSASAEPIAGPRGVIT